MTEKIQPKLNRGKIIDLALDKRRNLEDMEDRPSDLSLSQTNIASPFVVGNFDDVSVGSHDLTKESRSNFCGLCIEDPTTKFRARIFLLSLGVSVIVIVVLIVVFVVLLRDSIPSSYASNSTLHNSSVLRNISTLTFQSILPPGWPATGIRQDFDGNVIITGATGPPSLVGNTTAYIYYGPIDKIPQDFHAPSSLHLFYPAFPGEIVNASMLYGPNSAFYDSRIGFGNISAVGAYQPAGSPYQFSFVYEGPVNGSGTFSKIVIPSKVKDGIVDGPAKTVAHSTMGDLVVGNVYYQSSDSQSSGMIYNKYSKELILQEFGSYSTTLYGIWQNGGQFSQSYTIIGGTSNSPVKDNAFIVNYNYTTNSYSNFTEYSYNGNSSYDTHFEGITGVPGGFALAAVQVLGEDVGSSLVYIPVDKEDGSFGQAQWYTTTNTVNGLPTTGDTVLDFTLLGIYQTGPKGPSGLIPFSAFMNNFSAVVDFLH